jgi:hypothetical protein
VAQKAGRQSLSGRREGLTLLRSALSLSVNVLVSHPDELASQLVGRLPSQHPATPALRERAERGTTTPWLRPRWGSLWTGQTGLDSHWSVFSGSPPPCRILVSQDESCVAVVHADGRSFWDLASGALLSESEAEPAFTGVSWPTWEEDLPERQFRDEAYHRFRWEASTPPASTRVTCSLERGGTGHYGGQYNLRYESTVSLVQDGVQTTMYSDTASTSYALHGCLAAALWRDDRAVCAGLGGDVEVWSLAARTVQSAFHIPVGTVVAIAGFPLSDRIAALTLAGTLVVAPIPHERPAQDEASTLAPPTQLFLSPNEDRAVVAHADGCLSVWDTRTGATVVREPPWPSNCPFASQQLSTDLHFALLAAHGEDYYDGWLLAGLDLTREYLAFEFESHTTQDGFGSQSIERHGDRLYLRVDAWPHLLNEPDDGLRGPRWIDLVTGEPQVTAPTAAGEQLAWAVPVDVTEDARPSYSVTHAQLERSGPAVIFDNALACRHVRFTTDDPPVLFGLSPLDGCVVIATVSSQLHVLDVVLPSP